MIVTIRRRLLGLAFIAVIAGLVTLSIAAYNHAFTKVVLVTLRTDHTGNELLPAADVKVRGIVVGSVRAVHADSDHGATVKIALNPGKAKLIKNYDVAQLLPKTLFGETYVALQPDSPAVAAYCAPGQAPGPVRAGQTLCQDNSAQYKQLSELFTDITPLLDALQPAELNATLNALATALQGRGAQLGQNLTELDHYLTQLNPHVPRLVEDVTKLGQVATEYNGVAPDLLGTLDNLQTTTKTVVANRAALDQLLTVGAGTANVLSDFLAQNKQRLITVTSTSSQVFTLLAEYAPEYDCLLQGLADAEPKLEQAFAGGSLHITLEVVRQRGKYVPGNEPKRVTGYGPGCQGLPSPAVPYQPPVLPDGAPAVGADGGTLTGGSNVGALSSGDRGPLGPGSDAESKLVNTLVANEYGTTPDKVPAVTTILAAPILRGSEVSAQ